MDQLNQIFAEQKALNQRMRINTDKMDEQERQYWIVQYVLALFAELGETLNATNFKWWKQKKELDWQHLQEELIDCLHFLVSAMQVAGLDAAAAANLYLIKNRTNHERQDKGY